MVASFFDKTGYVATVSLQQRRTVNSEWYTTLCLPKVFEENRKTNQRRQKIVHQDNASSQTSAQTSAYLTGQNVEVMGPTPYSPDVARNDFFLFQHIKKKCLVNDFHRQKPCFGGVSIGVKKQSQMTVVRQNILSTVMLKNDKLCNGNARLHLVTPEICQPETYCANPRINIKFQFIFKLIHLHMS